MVYRYEDLIIWQLARTLVGKIYTSLQDVKDYGFKDQIQRASVSVMNNIAEGFQRHKFTTDNKTFISYLNIAYGSCGEVKSMLYIAEDIRYLDAVILKELHSLCTSLECKIEALMVSMRKNEKRMLNISTS